jgi:hypothetical protein
MKRSIGDALEESKIRNAESYRSARQQGKIAIKIFDGAFVLRRLFLPFLENVPNRLLCIFDALLRNKRVCHRNRPYIYCCSVAV